MKSIILFQNFWICLLILNLTLVKGLNIHSPPSFVRKRSALQNSIINTPLRILIVQNAGGGHGEIGYELCKTLCTQLGPESHITVLQDSKCDYSKPPFSVYDELVSIEKNRVRVIPSSMDLTTSICEDGNFDIVIDNWSKKKEDFALIKDNVNVKDSVKQYVFISSAGMYIQNGLHPHTESDDVTPPDMNGARQVEVAIESSGIAFTFIRPQYIYGPNMNKWYLDYFFECVAETGTGDALKVLPLPAPGDQLVSLTHIGDVSSLVAATVNNPIAINQGFNCGTDRFISYNSLAYLALRAMYDASPMSGGEKEATIQSKLEFAYYDPLILDKAEARKDKFPFRRETFVVSVDRAKKLLGWSPKHDLQGDMLWLAKDFISRKNDKDSREKNL